MGNLTITMKLFFHFFTLAGIFFINVKLAEAVDLDLDLVLSLQDYFDSKVLIFASEDVTPNTTFKKLSSFKFFMVAVNSHINLEEFFRNLQIYSFQKTLLVINGSTNFVLELLSAQNSKSIRSITWVVFDPDETQENIKNIYVPIKVKFLIIRKKWHINHELFIYQRIYDDYYHSTFFAVWENKKLLIKENKNFLETTDLHGKNFKVAKTPLAGTEDQYEKIWVLFSASMNFTIDWIVTSADANFYENGTKTGLFKMLDERLIDGTPSYFLVSNSRLTEYDFIWPTALIKTNIYMAVDTGLNWDSFVDPLNPKVWILIIVSIVFSWLVGYFIRNLHGFHINEDNFPLFNSFRAFCNQPGKIHGKTLSYYICYIMPYLLALVIVQHYSGALLSFLTVKNSGPPFNDLKGLVTNGQYKILVYNVAYALFYLRTNEGEEFAKIRKELLLPPNKHPGDPDFGFHQICRHKWVFITFTHSLKIKPHCNIKELKNPIFSSFDGILVRKDFPYQYAMTKMMKRLQYAGLIVRKYQNKIIPNEDPNRFDPMSLKIILPLFLLLSAFMGLSLVIFIAENTAFKN